jgi:protein-disulfide isomerase
MLKSARIAPRPKRVGLPRGEDQRRSSATSRTEATSPPVGARRSAKSAALCWFQHVRWSRIRFAESPSLHDGAEMFAHHDMKRIWNRRLTVLLASLLSLVLAGCTSSQSERVPGDACGIAASGSPVRGPDDAWVTIVQFEDFQCPACAAAQPTVHEIDAKHPGTVRWVFKYLPWSFHARALPAAIAAECAHEQQLFWPMHDILYEHQSAMSDTDLADYAAQVGLDIAAWTECLSSDPPIRRIAADIQQADDSKVDATPTFFVNGTPLVGAGPLEEFEALINTATHDAESSGLGAEEYRDALERHGCH